MIEIIIISLLCIINAAIVLFYLNRHSSKNGNYNSALKTIWRVNHRLYEINAEQRRELIELRGSKLAYYAGSAEIIPWGGTSDRTELSLESEQRGDL